MYKYDIHVHTKETSRCGYIYAADMIATYKEMGYAGVCITDHMHQGYYAEDWNMEGDWQGFITRLLEGYYAAKAAGEAAGMDVIMGVELRFPGSDRDYLIFGIDEEWLRNSENICLMTPEQFYEKYGSEVLIIQAHPFRAYDEVYTDCIHGIEIINANPRHGSRNELALELARKNPHFIRVCGSDMHRPGDEGVCAILTEERITDSFKLKQVLESGSFELYSPTFQEIVDASKADMAAREN